MVHYRALFEELLRSTNPRRPTRLTAGPGCAYPEMVTSVLRTWGWAWRHERGGSVA